MIPQNLKSMFGLKDAKDINMANNIWKMLDDMADSDPESYKKFIEKNLNEGITEVKQEKQKKEKPFKITPKQGILIKMEALLKQKLLSEKLDLNEKVDFQKEKWSDVKSKFSEKVQIYLNICFSERVKDPIFKSQVSGTNYTLADIKSIEQLFYSLQGPFQEKEKQEKVWYFVMIMNEKFYSSLEKTQGSKKILIGIAMSYFEERLSSDRNPLFKLYNPELYERIAYYGIQRMSIRVCPQKYLYGKSKKPDQFLLQSEVDKKERPKTKLKQEAEIIKQQKKQEIKFFEKKESKPQILPELRTQEKKKKPLIEVIEEHENEQRGIPYEMKETEEGYHLQFLLAGVKSIEDINLQVNQKTVRVEKQGQKVEIQLSKRIKQDQVKAKLKKKLNKLFVQLLFI